MCTQQVDSHSICMLVIIPKTSRNTSSSLHSYNFSSPVLVLWSSLKYFILNLSLLYWYVFADSALCCGLWTLSRPQSTAWSSFRYFFFFPLLTTVAIVVQYCGHSLSTLSCITCLSRTCCCPSGGTPRKQTVTVQRPAEQSFSQQFVRPQQLLEGKVKPSRNIYWHSNWHHTFLFTHLMAVLIIAKYGIQKPTSDSKTTVHL